MDDLWYSEYHTDGVRFFIKVNSQIHHEKSEYQTISVFDCVEFGRCLTLDGVLMLTEKDEFIYHEMIIHPAMAVNPNIQRVLVIGAGDGGAVRELTKYSAVKQIEVVEIDERVVEVSKEYLPNISCGFKDSRVLIHFEDGLKFIRRKKNAYDLIIVDSTDPFGPGEVLFTKEFYGNCFRALTGDGVLINQQESPFYASDAKEMQQAHRRIAQTFPVSRVYQAHIPTYPSGHWLFGFASKGFDPVKSLQADHWNELNISTRYYNTDLHKGAFCLPNYVKEMLCDE